MKVSVYKEIKSGKSSGERDIELVMSSIKDGTFAKLVLSVMQEEDKEKRDGFKKKLLSFTPAGVFHPRRTEDGLTEPTHIIVLDIDYDDPDKCRLVAQLDKHVRFGFVSPSGKGYKMFVSITPDREIESWKDYYYNAFAILHQRFLERYDIELDPSGKNINRVCFVSYDPELVSKSATPLTVNPTPPPVSKKKQMEGEETSDIDFKMDLAKRFVNNHKSFEEGRNNYIYEIASTLNRMGVEMEDAIVSIGEHFELPGYDTPGNEWVKSIDSAYKHHKDEHGTKTVVVDGEAPRPVFKEGSVEMDTYRLFCKVFKGIDNIDHCRDIIKHYHIGKKTVSAEYNIERETFVQIATLAYEDTRSGDELQSMHEMSSYISRIFESTRPPIAISKFNLGSMDGWMPGNIVGIVGAEGSYKSFYALTEVIQKALLGIPSFFGNYEMSDYQLIKRLCLMILGVDLESRMKSLSNTSDRKAQVADLMRQIEERVGNNLLIHNLPGAKPSDIANTIESHQLKTGDSIKFGVIDGIWGLHQWHQNEISSAMKNAAELKEFTKKSMIPFLALSHSKTGTMKHFRNQHDFVLGGRKILSNLDGFISMSRVVDENRSNIEQDDFIYRSDVVWARYDNRRESSEVIDAILSVSENLMIEETNYNPRQFEHKNKQEGSRRRIN